MPYLTVSELGNFGDGITHCAGLVRQVVVVQVSTRTPHKVSI
jgi:hypothetical protein